MKAFIKRDEYLLMDFDPQFNLFYIYSAKTQMPVYYRILPGNIREVKAFKNCLLEARMGHSG